jgi:hypothetical protein
MTSMTQRVTLATSSNEHESFEEFKDTRNPYLLVAIKDDGNAVILEAHSEGIEWLRDGLDDDEFFEAYCDDAPTELGVYEWQGKIDGSKSFEGENDYWLTGDWTLIWKRDA